MPFALVIFLVVVSSILKFNILGWFLGNTAIGCPVACGSLILFFAFAIFLVDMKFKFNSQIIRVYENGIYSGKINNFFFYFEEIQEIMSIGENLKVFENNALLSNAFQLKFDLNRDIIGFLANKLYHKKIYFYKIVSKKTWNEYSIIDLKRSLTTNSAIDEKIFSVIATTEPEKFEHAVKKAGYGKLLKED
ncbi:hypothetical protein KO465_09600 [Candidatus Micrarchaeota archaeon]|nr:hypothetical protein [Candidatus Micrarchaeota archaeon]